MLKIHLLGSFELTGPNGRQAVLPTRKCEALLSLLLLRPGQLLTRSSIVGTLWRDMPETQARRCLSSDLWRVRQTLYDLGVDPNSILETNHHSVGLKKMSSSALWVDVCEFRELCASCCANSSKVNNKLQLDMEQGLKLYRGDLLEGTYDDWSWMERESLRNQYFDLVRRLMMHHKAQCQWQEVIHYGQRLLIFDPLLEDVHRDIMRAYLAMGSRSSAMRQFETCASGLKDELGSDPMPETMMLFSSISTHSVSLPDSRGNSIIPNVNHENLLEQAMGHLSAAEDLLKLVRN